MMTSHTSLYQSNYVDVGNAEHIVAVLKLLRGTSEDPHPGPMEKKKPGLGKVSVFDQRNHAPTGLPLTLLSSCC